MRSMRSDILDGTKKSKKITSVLKDQSGYSLIFIMFLLYATLLGSFVLVEAYRIFSIYDRVEYTTQRAVNIAIEEFMWDSWGRDKFQELEQDEAKDRFWEYLNTQGILPNSEFDISDCAITVVESDPSPFIQAQGTIKISSWFAYLRDSGEVIIPFSVRSRNARIDI